MEQCTVCEQMFKSYAPLVLTVKKSGDEILVYAKNNSPNILLIKRLVLCLEYPQDLYVIYIRQGGYFDLLTGGERLNQSLSQLKFRISVPTPQKAQAQAEYIEVTGRSISCVYEFSS